MVAAPSGAPSNAPSSAPLCQAPDPSLRATSWALPPGAVDCHAHICGPAEQFPYWDQRIYTPPDALLPDYRALLDSLGVPRAVLVQPSVYADDNRALVAALLTDPQRLRGVAVLNSDENEFADADIDGEIERLHAAGVRGLRCNIVDVALGKGHLPRARLMALAERIAPWGWHLEFLMHANEFPDLADTLAALPVPSVLGHFGYVPTRCTVQDAGFQSLLSLVREGRTWVKLTGPYRINADASWAATRYADVRPFADALVRANPRQLLWGTDWPHVMVKGAMPHDADLCAVLGDWVTDGGLRQQIWVDNAERLYGFEPWATLSQA